MLAYGCLGLYISSLILGDKMSKRHVRDIAIVIVIVFLVTIFVFPEIFGTNQQSMETPPPELELTK